MNALWNFYCTWFESRQEREKQILAAGLVGCVLWLGVMQWAMPAFTQSTKLATQANSDRAMGESLAAQMRMLEQQVSSPNTALLASLQQKRSSYSEQEPQIQSMQKALVSARKMSAFLESLLAGNKTLQLVSLETLAPEAVESAVTVDEEAKAKSKPVDAGPRLYKHGVRLRLSGGYRELMAYLTDLEQAPQRVLWGDMKLSVNTHPKVELTLTVYTLSLDKAWMTL